MRDFVTNFPVYTYAVYVCIENTYLRDPEWWYIFLFKISPTPISAKPPRYLSHVQPYTPWRCGNTILVLKGGIHPYYQIGGYLIKLQCLTYLVFSSLGFCLCFTICFTSLLAIFSLPRLPASSSFFSHFFIGIFPFRCKIFFNEIPLWNLMGFNNKSELIMSLRFLVGVIKFRERSSTALSNMDFWMKFLSVKSTVGNDFLKNIIELPANVEYDANTLLQIYRLLWVLYTYSIEGNATERVRHMFYDFVKNFESSLCFSKRTFEIS